MQTTTDQVRQVLMNELGLTRDSIRQLVEQIVKETVESKIKAMDQNGQMDRIVESAFERKYRDPNNGYVMFKTLISDAAQKVAAEVVKKHISISVK